MELRDVLRRRRMVRAYDPDRAVPDDVVDRLLAAALRAPSAGWTQATDVLVLREPADRERFWAVTAPPVEPDAWRRGLSSAPLLLVLWTSRQAYLDRYAEPDKGWTDRDPARWPVPWWYVDAGMSALLVLLTAVDEELGACLFGVPGDRVVALREAFGVPADREPLGVISVGVPAPDRRSLSLRRPRRTMAEVVHEGSWSAPYRPASDDRST